MHTAHDVAVQVFAQLEQAWNASDGATFGSMFADETDFVDVRGSHHCVDSVAVGTAHQALFDTHYASTAIAYRVETARAIAPDVIVTVVGATLMAPPGPRPPTDPSLRDTDACPRHNQWSQKPSLKLPPERIQHRR